MDKPKTTASELADKLTAGDRCEAASWADEKLFRDSATELRRLKEIELNSDAICDINDELRKRIAELERLFDYHIKVKANLHRHIDNHKETIVELKAELFNALSVSYQINKEE